TMTEPTAQGAFRSITSKRQQSVRETRVMSSTPFASSEKHNNRPGMILGRSSQEKRRHPFPRKRKNTRKRNLTQDCPQVEQSMTMRFCPRKTRSKTMMHLLQGHCPSPYFLE